jgi:ubiquinone/menaquinone biosynthesis C-methylase UbiE
MPARSPADAGHAGEFGPESYRFWRTTSLGEVTELLERRLILRFAGPLKGCSTLDVGCGDGALTRSLRQGGAARVVGCDVDPRMIARAAATAAESGVQIVYALARAEQLPFPERSFDLVTAITVLAFISDPVAAVREMARVLKPGGRLVIGDLGKWSLWAAGRRLRSWFGAAMWRPARFRSARELTALAQAAGMRVEHVSGAVYYPRSALLAQLMAPLDPLFGELTTFGAAFVAVRSRKD